MVEAPLILDRYRPLADLGAGGHGSVVLAFDTKMARRVAIKRLPRPLDAAGRALARTGLAEARTAAMLNHPNIVTVHEWDTDDDEAFIVMEHLDGASLAEILDTTDEPFTLDEAAAIVAGVSAALAFAHANGVLHLDLKPANVIVTRDGHVKVADFGVSALTDITGRASGTAGTIGYMPPEQLRRQALDERTDGWALATLAFEVLTNANPFDAETAEGSLFKIDVADLPAPSEFEPDLPRAVDDVLVAGLAADPFDRYESATAFAGALLPHLGNPEAGRESLAEVVDGLLGTDEADEEADYEPLGLWDRLAPHADTARRAIAAIASAWLAYSAIEGFGLDRPARIAGAVVVALAAALAPGLGAALGFGLFAVGAAIALGWVPGLVIGLVLAAFWAARGRAGRTDAFAPVIGPVLGVIHAAPAAPLLLGFAYPPIVAALTSGVTALAVMAAAVMSGAWPPLLSVCWHFLSDPLQLAPVATDPVSRLLTPGTGIMVLAWMLAGALTSLGCRRATRAGAFAGVLAGGAALLGGYVAWSWLSHSFGPEAFALDLTLGVGLALVVVALGAPTRPEEE